MTAVTEVQKKQIMILLATLLTIVIYVSGIAPMQKEIEANEIKLTTVEAERLQMQKIVENKNIELEYINLREEYETKFQQRFENFDINEKVEAIAKEFNMPIKSIKIKGFEPVSPAIYENYIAQPKTREELEQVKKDEKTPIFSLLLSSTVSLTLDINGLEDELKMYDAFNNIIPIGPGDADEDRFCLLVPSLDLKNLNQITPQGTRVNSIKPVTYPILIFAMETMDLTEWDAEFEARKQGTTS